MGFASAILTVHRQGRILLPTLRSLIAAKHHAAGRGHTVDLVIVADRCDAPTRRLLDAHADQFAALAETEHGDPGAARRTGVALAERDYIFFHDADDLYSIDWYARFLDHVASCATPPRAVYHGEIMVGFGDEFYYRLQTASDDPGFDPMALVCQWYFATNCMAPAAICREVPIPDHNARKGVGHDDWAWSCDTLAAGIPRRIVPRTISFYREKPVGVGVGKVPGIIHPRSRLFDPASVRASTARMAERHNAAEPFGFAAPADGRNRAVEGFVPDWVLDQVRIQAAFEPMLTDLLDIDRAPRMFRALPQQNHVALAWRDLCESLDERPKIIVTASEASLVAADVVIGEIVRAASAHDGGACQVICLVEGDRLKWNRPLHALTFGALLLDVRRFREQYGLEFWYFNRFIIRLFVQPVVRCVVDLGSALFAKLFDEFCRPLCALIPDIRFAYPMLEDDPINEARMNVNAGLDLYARTTAQPARVFSVSDRYGAFLASQPCLPSVLPGARRQALATALLHRFARDPQTRAAALETADLGGFLLSDPAPHAAPGPSGATPCPARARYPRERVFALTSRHAVYAPDLHEQAQELLARESGVELLVPQVIFWLERGGQKRCQWIEPNDMAARLGAICDLMATHGVDIPLFAICRAWGPTYATLRAFQAAQAERPAVDFCVLLRRIAQTAKVLPLPAAICTTDRPVTLNRWTLLDHV